MPNITSNVGEVTTSPKSELWFWEGNIQARVIEYLYAQGYNIVSQADTASHQQGKDIIAEKDGKRLWVSVKGFPAGTTKTRPTTQAHHWFSHAVFDILCYREENQIVFLAVALPDLPKYRAMAKKISWFKPVANFVYLWVSDDGEVEME